MRIKTHYIYIYALLLLTLAGCGGEQTNCSGETGDTLRLRHAKSLTIVEYADRTEVTLRNPWDTTKVYSKYFLTQDHELKIPNATSQQTVHTPLRKLAAFSSVHCALFHELGAADCVGGICDLQFINLPYYKQAVADGRILDLGSSMQPNLESVINLSPDAMLPSPFENSGGLGRVETLGIPIIWCADYMEHTPLGRAEWMRFYGRLVGKAREADSIFLTIEKRYTELRQLAKSATTKPRLLPEMPWSGQWTLPGSGSSSTVLYADAGSEYLFAHLKGNGGIPLSTEKVVDKGVDADIWLIKHHGPLSREQMVSDTPLLRGIKAPIWWCDTSESLIYEETPFHPERLLENLIAILHPELGVTSKYQYFQELK